MLEGHIFISISARPAWDVPRTITANNLMITPLNWRSWHVTPMYGLSVDGQRRYLMLKGVV